MNDLSFDSFPLDSSSTNQSWRITEGSNTTSHFFCWWRARGFCMNDYSQKMAFLFQRDTVIHSKFRSSSEMKWRSRVVTDGGVWRSHGFGCSTSSFFAHTSAKKKKQPSIETPWSMPMLRVPSREMSLSGGDGAPSDGCSHTTKCLPWWPAGCPC